MTKLNRIISSRTEWVDLFMLGDKRLQTNVTPFEVTIGSPKRSTKQNSLIHALFSQCAIKTCKKTAEWWKQELKSKLGKLQVHFDLEERPTTILVSTSQYSKAETNDFVIKIQAHMALHHQVDIEIKEIQEFLTTKE